MAINLGLEALVPDSHSEPTLSYEYLDAVIEYAAASDEITMVFDQFEDILVAAENLAAIHESIVDNGVTPALEALVGGNFVDGLSLEAVEASMEAAGNAIINILAKIWMAIKSFFTKFFGMSGDLAKRLKAWKSNIKGDKTYNVGREFEGISFTEKTNIEATIDSIAKWTVAEGKKTGKYEAVAMGQQGTQVKEIGFVKHNFDQNQSEALKYADMLISLITSINNKENQLIKICDTQINDAEKKIKEIKSRFNKQKDVNLNDTQPGSPVARAKDAIEDQDYHINNANMAKKNIVAVIKAISSSATRFLTNNTIKGDTGAKQSNADRAGL